MRKGLPKVCESCKTEFWGWRRGKRVFCSKPCRTAARVAGTPTYHNWEGMKSRCQNPKAIKYAEYGGAGITVCERWQVFMNFLADMGERPTNTHSLDRIDGTKGYEPGNVRWATRVEQTANRRTTRWLTIDGETLPIAEWSRRWNIDLGNLSFRVKNWPQERWQEPVKRIVG